jgi:hypothetical protein
MTSRNVARLRHALGDLELGEYDEHILDWLATWEPSTAEVIATWIERARDEGPRRRRQVHLEQGDDGLWSILDPHNETTLGGVHETSADAGAEARDNGWMVVSIRERGVQGAGE